MSDKKELRKYGLMMGAVISALFGVALPLVIHRGASFPRWPWIVAGMFWTLALVSPSTLGVVRRLWMAFGEKMGHINTRILMAVSYWVMVVPLGFLVRLFSKTSIDCRFDQKRSSYRVPHRRTITEKQMETPF